MVSTAIKIILLVVGSVAFVAIYFRLRILLEGLRVTSWYRSPRKNREVGGMDKSKHLIGWAFDVTPNNKKTMDKLRGMGLKVVAESDHIHAQVI